MNVAALGPDVVEIITPAPDSQYRLIPCDCGNPAPVYAKYITQDNAEAWRVVCTYCGKTVDINTTVRHQAQLAWNRRERNG